MQLVTGLHRRRSSLRMGWVRITRTKRTASATPNSHPQNYHKAYDRDVAQHQEQGVHGPGAEHTLDFIANLLTHHKA